MKFKTRTNATRALKNVTRVLNNYFAVFGDKVGNLGNGGYRPGENIKEVERRYGAEMRKYRVYPHNAENAGAENNDYSRHKALAETARGGNGAVHKRGNHVGKAHYHDTVHSRSGDLGVVGENGKKLIAEGKEKKSQHRAGNKRVAKTDKIAFEHAAALARTEVLPHKGRTGSVERRHDVVDYRVGVGGGGVALDHYMVKGVDGRLYEEVCDGKNSVLKSCGYAKHEHAFDLSGIETDKLRAQAALAFVFCHTEKHKKRRNILRDYTCERHTVDRHIANYDENKVENDVYNAGTGQIDQRAAGVSLGTQHGVTEVEYTERGHSERVYAKIKHRTVDQLVLCMYEREHWTRQNEARNGNYDPRKGTEYKRGVHRLGGVALLLGTEELSDAHVDSAAHADEHAGKEGDEYRRRSDRPQRKRA